MHCLTPACTSRPIAHRQTAPLPPLQAMVHPFLSKKMKDRIRLFGSDYSALHQLVDPAMLPPDFGGTSTDDGWDWFENMTQPDSASS